MKKFFLSLIFLLAADNAFSHKVKLKITNVKQNGGKVVISLNSSEETFKKHVPDKVLILETPSTEIETVIEIPSGEYAFSIFQDLNNDEEINSNLIGIPKEPFGFSNYNGKSAPGNFKKHKVIINQDSEITIALFEM